MTSAQAECNGACLQQRTGKREENIWWVLLRNVSRIWKGTSLGLVCKTDICMPEQKKPWKLKIILWEKAGTETRNRENMHRNSAQAVTQAQHQTKNPWAVRWQHYLLCHHAILFTVLFITSPNNSKWHYKFPVICYLSLQWIHSTIVSWY